MTDAYRQPRSGGRFAAKHGMHLSSEYRSWQMMKNRCYNPRFPAFKRYGARAHRFSYALHFGAPEAGAMVLHACNNPSCVNPEHLRVGDHAENMRDRMLAGNYPTNERAPAAKFSDAVVAQVRAAVGTYEKIGKRFGMSASQVGNIRRGDQRPEASA